MSSAAVSGSPLRHWSGWIPLAIPLFLLALGVRHVALYGLVVEADEGAEAHLFQLLMPVQLVAMAYFALAWVPRAPRSALVVLAVQIAAAGLVFAFVFWAEHAAA